jgi:predicted dehydrogenase
LQHRSRPILSDLERVKTTLGQLLAVEANVSWWRPQAYYDDSGRGSYARDGGGVLISQAIHALDLMLSLTGPVSEVTAMAATTGFHRMESEDFVSAGLQFANRAAGQFFASTASFPGRGETITLHFQHGSAHLEAGLLTIHRKDGRREVFGQASASDAGAIRWRSPVTGTDW